MTIFAQSSPIERSQVSYRVSRVRAPSFDTTAILAGVALLIVFAIVICLDSMSPGTTPDELLSKLATFP
jgi:hypothetical protein